MRWFVSLDAVNASPTSQDRDFLTSKCVTNVTSDSLIISHNIIRNNYPEGGEWTAGIFFKKFLNEAPLDLVVITHNYISGNGNGFNSTTNGDNYIGPVIRNNTIINNERGFYEYRKMLRTYTI